jgi:ATP-dependent Zn protease
MATAEAAERFGTTAEAADLAQQLRRLARVATFVAALTSPVVYIWLHHHVGWSMGWSLAATVGMVIAFRGFVDVVIRRLIPWPSLWGADDAQMREEDIANRRRAWWWRQKYRLLAWIAVFVTIIFVVQWLKGDTSGWFDSAKSCVDWFYNRVLTNTTLWQQLFILPLFLVFNFLILFGPLVIMGVSQIRGYEPGDADWGVKLKDVRGQAEAKEEVRKIVTLWQSGEHFEKAGGKRERGLLFHGPPGTGKTMLAKAIATSFNAPFISIPGSGFAQTFIGIDAVIVRLLAWRAKRLARKWGGQCIVFIDEIDAVGMRRQALQSFSPGPEWSTPTQFYGQFGATNPSCDQIHETREWRDWLFEQRAPQRRSPYPGWAQKLGSIVNQLPGGMMGGMGQLALNQLLVVMDGLDNPPFMRRTFTTKLNTWTDATYIIPRRIGKAKLRLPPPHPRKEQIYFIGATNVPLHNLDPALTRPGRMGRHVFFRTPTKNDRKDIFELYLGKVAHSAELDDPKRRDEIARITNGYSPAMIDQVCSLALTYAQHEGRIEFTGEDLLTAMSTIESGTVIDVHYTKEETRAVAIHEAGHAATAHIYRPEIESSRLSIRMRPDGSLGHHQSFDKEERFSVWREEMFGSLIHGVGAMAAEKVFYGDTSGGVGGDLHTTTEQAATMVGRWGMGPIQIPLDGLKFADETEEQTRQRVMKRFEQVGLRLMNRTRGSADVHQDPIASVLMDPYKRAAAAILMGQAFVVAENFIRANKDKVEAVADAVIAKGEIYGDNLNELLDAQSFVKPEIDYSKEETWPQI